ncbi:MAG: type II toxin-antitoxin system RelE/ParE family toxin [Chthoniobacterales bacterium]|nr:type II toxin-antitoxin system RelE/ParE family toxin [Chthoniobacterales bacterium]
MASFEVRWRASTKKDLRRRPPDAVARVIETVDGLAQEPLPHGSEKLAGSDHTYRIRLGDYRVVDEFLRAASVIEIQRVRHRKDVYR